MKDNARLVLEENQNLLEQISVKDNKAYDLHQAHVKEGICSHLLFTYELCPYEKLFLGFLTCPDTNRPLQSQKKARILKFQI